MCVSLAVVSGLLGKAVYAMFYCFIRLIRNVLSKLFSTDIIWKQSMKQITLKIGPMGNADTVVLDENGEIMDSVRKVEVISEAEEITVARVTFAFPRISGSARSQEPCSLSMLGSDYETKVIPEAGSSRPSE